MLAQFRPRPTPAQAGHLVDTLARHTHQISERVRGVPHRRITPSPGTGSVRIEAQAAWHRFVAHVMVILDFRVKHLAKDVRREQVPCEYALGPVIARLGHHVLQARLLLQFLQHCGFFQRRADGHRRYHMQPAVHAHLDVPRVIGRAGENGHRIHVAFSCQQVFQRVVDIVAAIIALQRLAAGRVQVRDGRHRAVGMFVPVERGAESAAHHRQTHFPATLRRVRPARSQPHVGGCGQHGCTRRPQLKERAARERTSLFLVRQRLQMVNHGRSPCA